MKDPGTPYRLEMRADSLSSTEEVIHLSTRTSRGDIRSEYVCERVPVFYASSEMNPKMPWLERSPNFPGEASCMLIVHITRWKVFLVPCRDPTESPRPPLHLKKGPNMPLTTQKPRGVHCFKFLGCLTIFNIDRNPNITLSNRKRDLNSHLTSRSVRIVLPRLVYISELSLIPRLVSWLHLTNSSFEWTSPP